MPRNGSGLYQLPSGINPVVTQTLVTSNWANTTMEDLALAITNSIAKDGQTTPTADLPMGGFKHINVGAPALRNQYATLATAQDSTAIRVTGVAGVNDITGTLPGGASSLVMGQLIQLIPANDNTGPATLNINGIGAKEIVTDIGSPMAEGNLIAGVPYLMMYNGEDLVMLTGGAGAVSQSAITGWFRPTPTGPYPEITIFDSATVTIPGGEGRIVRPGTRDLSGVKEVTWATQNVAITNLAVAWATLLTVDENGNVVQFAGEFNQSWVRDHIIIGTVTHINGQINSVWTTPAIYGDMLYASFDLATLFNNTFISGGQLYANGTNPFRVNQSPGAFFSLGANSDELNSPNITQTSLVEGVEFFPVTGTSVVGAATMNIPVTMYDPGGAGVITALPGTTTATIHRMYKLGDEYLFVYGQDDYPDLATALNSIAIDDSAFQPPGKLGNATFLGRIVAQKNCANLNDPATARFITGNSIGSGGSSGGGISDAPVDGNTYGRRDATWVEVVPQPAGAAGTERLIDFYTGALLRWRIGADGEAESGSNAGSDFVIRAYDDAGASLGNATKIDRATRETTLYANTWVETSSNPTVSVRATGNPADSRLGFFYVDTSGHVTIRSSTDAFALKSQLRLLPTGGLALDTVAGSPFWQVTPNRVTADFNNVNLNQRLTFQPNASGGASVSVMPAGAGTTAFWNAYGGTDLLNTHSAAFGIDGTAAFISSSKSGSGTTKPFEVRFDGVTKIAADVNGNISYSGANLISGASSAFIATTGSGLIALRPAGIASSTGQFTVRTTFTDTFVPFRVYYGTTSTQNILQEYGWNDQVSRWKWVLESNATFALYGYDSAGSTPTRIASFSSPVSGGATPLLDVAGQVHARGSGSGLVFSDRGDPTNVNHDWMWYAVGAAARLWKGSTGDRMTVTDGSIVSAINFVATSDANLKTEVTNKSARRGLADKLRLVNFIWKDSGVRDQGLIAQEVREIAPEYVHEVDGKLAIDKMGLLLECVIDLAARVSDLENGNG